jgi:hypothetical protein
MQEMAGECLTRQRERNTIEKRPKKVKQALPKIVRLSSVLSFACVSLLFNFQFGLAYNPSSPWKGIFAFAALKEDGTVQAWAMQPMEAARRVA